MDDLAQDFDVVIVGAGGAGLIAAVEAAESGARVLVIEKGSEIGGITATSIGSITVSGSPFQVKAGIPDDTAEAHFRDLLKLVEGNESQFNLDASRLVPELGREALSRLMELGVEFSGVRPEPPHSAFRMHNVVPSSRSYIDVLSRNCLQRGVTIRKETTIGSINRDPHRG